MTSERENKKPFFKLKPRPDFDISVYECEYYLCEAATHGCFFCKHCTAIFYDYTVGPYALVCDLNSIESYIDCGLHCDNFKER